MEFGEILDEYKNLQEELVELDNEQTSAYEDYSKNGKMSAGKSEHLGLNFM